MVEQAGDAVVAQEFVHIIAILGVVRFGHSLRQGVKRRQPGDFDSGNLGGAFALLQFRVQRPQHGFDVVVAGTAMRSVLPALPAMA